MVRGASAQSIALRRRTSLELLELAHELCELGQLQPTGRIVVEFGQHLCRRRSITWHAKSVEC